MNHKIFAMVIIVSTIFAALITIPFNNSPLSIANASQLLPQTSTQKDNTTQIVLDKTPQVSQKRKIRVINNEIDLDPETKLTAKEQARFEKCKSDIKSKRTKRFKNKPTPCLKLKESDLSNDKDLNAEDYNILWTTVAENKELSDKTIDQNKEIPLNDFINSSTMEIVTDSSGSSSSSSNSSGISNSSSLSSSSKSVLSSSSSSTSIISSSKSSSSSSKSSSSSSSSANSSTETKSSINSSSISVSKSSITTSSLSSSSSIKTSFLESIFNIGTISASAGKEDGFMLPYPKDADVTLTQGPFSNEYWGVQHASHWDYSAFDFVATTTTITASKGGRVVYSSNNDTKGFGHHIIIEHNDGSYTLYAHLSSRSVIVDQLVTASQIIGKQGASGNQVASHLHFESFSRYPCTTSSKVENCWVENKSAFGGWKGGSYYLQSAMLPKFIECNHKDNIKNCTNGYPSVPNAVYKSQNTPAPTNPNKLPINPRNSNYSGFNSSFNFDVQGAGDANGTQVKLWESTGNLNQRWGYDANTKTIKGLSNKCLDAGDTNDLNNRWLRIHDCHFNPNQQWAADSMGRIHTLANTNLCIDSAQYNTKDSYLYVGSCHGGYNQQWDVWKLGMPTNFNKYNKSLAYKPNQSFRFDVVGANPQDQTRVQLWQDNGGINQKWGYDSGTERIIGLNDKCLDAGDINNPSNRWLRINQCHSGSNQKWIVDEKGRLKTRANDNLCLDSAHGGKNEAWLYMHPCHDGENQTFSSDAGIKIVVVNNFKQLYLSHNSNFVFDIEGGNNNNQTPIKLFQRNGNWNQNFTYNGQTQEFKSQNGKCIDGGAMWSTNGWDRGIRIQDCHGGSNQKWWIDNLGRIHNKYTDKLGDTCLDAIYGASNGSFIFSGGCNNGSNQRWSGL